MKKLLLIALVLLGVSTLTIAQDGAKKEVIKKEVVVKTPKADTTAAAAITKEATIKSISEKMDQFIVSQNETISKLETKIDRANRRMQDLQNQSSLRWLLRDLIPIVVLAIIGAFIVAIIYVIANNNYRNNILKYDTLVKCTDKTGVVPDFFNKIERQKLSVAPPQGRVNLVLSLLCGIMSVVFIVVSMDTNDSYRKLIAVIAMLVFASAAFLLFKQYNRISENIRKEQ